MTLINLPGFQVKPWLEER
jgi:hypothetical protein